MSLFGEDTGVNGGRPLEGVLIGNTPFLSSQNAFSCPYLSGSSSWCLEKTKHTYYTLDITVFNKKKIHLVHLPKNVSE